MSPKAFQKMLEKVGDYLIGNNKRAFSGCYSKGFNTFNLDEGSMTALKYKRLLLNGTENRICRKHTKLEGIWGVLNKRYFGFRSVGRRSE